MCEKIEEGTWPYGRMAKKLRNRAPQKSIGKRTSQQLLTGLSSSKGRMARFHASGYPPVCLPRGWLQEVSQKEAEGDGPSWQPGSLKGNGDGLQRQHVHICSFSKGFCWTSFFKAIPIYGLHNIF